VTHSRADEKSPNESGARSRIFTRVTEPNPATVLLFAVSHAHDGKFSEELPVALLNHDSMLVIPRPSKASFSTRLARFYWQMPTAVYDMKLIQRLFDMDS
jgi:hypothetical protein